MNDLGGDALTRKCYRETDGQTDAGATPIWTRGGSVVAYRTPEREVGGLKPTAAVLCPWARHFTPWKYWLITQEAVAPSRHDWKIVDWDVKPQHKQKPSEHLCGFVNDLREDGLAMKMFIERLMDRQMPGQFPSENLCRFMNYLGGDVLTRKCLWRDWWTDVCQGNPRLKTLVD